MSLLPWALASGCCSTPSMQASLLLALPAAAHDEQHAFDLHTPAHTCTHLAVQ